ncbi:hypothetical protein H6P81_014061 [Aristolochia fimbriata]|uniref:Aminotransferase-like plant mobile domain-containing protein n=1 Tax=Aristolochia fimbriata TaxID=158543 RepID=A0AAV7EL50_ARIFI|nr:hypothetical protein H6P81_014061 [Aristolochia fimbriata]
MESGLTTRCSPTFFLETIQKAKLKKKHIRAIEKTPFGHFLKVKGGHIEATLVSSLANKYCKVRNSFLIGKRYMEFSAADVSNIMGLPFEGSHLVVGRCKNIPDFVVNHFHGKAPNRKDITRKLRRLVRKDGDMDTITKLVILMVFVCILFPQANYGIPLTLYRYIDDLNGLKEYAWGEALHRHIILQLSRKKAKNNGYFTGCALAMTVKRGIFTSALSLSLRPSDTDRLLPNASNMRNIGIFICLLVLCKLVRYFQLKRGIFTFALSHSHRPSDTDRFLANSFKVVFSVLTSVLGVFT